jgi:ribosomal protein L37AE/L43A
MVRKLIKEDEEWIDATFICPKCKRKDYTAMNPFEAYCHTCKGYFNQCMEVVYKKRIPWDKIYEMKINRKN